MRMELRVCNHCYDGEHGTEALPAIVASIEGQQIQLSDTQLMMEDENENMLVYPEVDDILEVLTRNIDEMAEQTRQDVTVELSS